MIVAGTTGSWAGFGTRLAAEFLYAIPDSRDYGLNDCLPIQPEERKGSQGLCNEAP